MNLFRFPVVEYQIYFATLFTGGLISAVSTICFGILVYGPNGTMFAVMCAVCRIVCGVGCAFTWSTSVPVLVSGFPRWEKNLPNLVEMSFAIGCLFGPVTGSLLYKLGGYITPFATAAIGQSLISVISYFLIPGYKNPSRSKSCEAMSSVSSNRYAYKDDAKTARIDYDRLLDSIKERETTATNFMTSLGNVCLSILIFSCGISLGFVSVAIAPFLRDSFGVDQGTAGYYFILYSGLNVATYFPVAALNQKGWYGLLFIISGVTGVLGYAGLTSLYFLKNDSAFFFLIPFSMLGFMAPLLLTSSYQLLEKAAKLSGLKDSARIKLYVSIWLNITLNAGAMFGQSITGGFIFELGSFYFSCAIHCLLCLTGVIFGSFYLAKEKLILSC